MDVADGYFSSSLKTPRMSPIFVLFEVQYGLEDRALPKELLDAIVFASGNPHRVRTLTLIEPSPFWMLPTTGTMTRIRERCRNS